MVVILYKKYRLTINTITRTIVNDEKLYILSRKFYLKCYQILVKIIWNLIIFYKK